MISAQYAWLVWSTAFLVPWILLYGRFPAHRAPMRWASLFTMPFGLTEPLFVPEYWAPPSLFDLAARTGFDIESLIFSFAIGGVGAVLVNIFTRRTLAAFPSAMHKVGRHRFHRWALLVPFGLFPVLMLVDWNPIFPAIIAMLVGSALAVWCRSDLIWPTVFGGALFLGYYVVFLTGLWFTAPTGYIRTVWNLEALTGVVIGFMPLEELLFAVAFGAYWAGLYEHARWQQQDVRLRSV
ncbi:MAG: lycopene cyclase domain-containing protein [Gemmatimonadota bacterium]